MARIVNNHRHRTPVLFHSRSRLKIGLVGGSFNPAHEGHIHVALEARQKLGLDQIWWLVSPQNPLKSAFNMAPLAKRLTDARKTATPFPFLRVMAPEAGLQKNYTYNTLKFISKTMPLARLVWVMGADNLDQLTKWYRYHDMIQLLPIAVIDRPSYSLKAIAAGRCLLGRRNTVRKMRRAIAKRSVKLPSWCFITGQHNPASATEIRQQAYNKTINSTPKSKA
ncbi:nicotinate-nicotinamide nucleotide adenylyltransferase [Candidatus Puniceispirillum sp.]|nr:nicotinate-nicotinamide nucleotide adenylyltransferase [Candidatus Puniceispirillum sp.]